MCEQSELSELNPGAQKARKPLPLSDALYGCETNPGHTKLDTFCDGFGFEKANLFCLKLPQCIAAARSRSGLTSTVTYVMSGGWHGHLTYVNR